MTKDLLMILIPVLIIFIGFVSLLIVLVKRGRKDIAFKIVYSLMVVSEKYYGPGTGPRKHKFVKEIIETIYNAVPPLFKKYISLDDIDDFIVSIHVKCKEYIEAQK